MSLPADGVNANTLAETTTIPTGKKLIFLDPDTNEGGIITLENLTKQILSNLTSQTFNLDQGNKTLLAALNELNSKGSQIVASGINKSFYKMYVLEGGVPLTIELKYDAGYFLVVAGLNSNNISPSTTNVYTVITAAETRKSDVSIVRSSTSDINVSIEGNKLTLSSTTWKKIFIK